MVKTPLSNRHYHFLHSLLYLLFGCNNTSIHIGRIEQAKQNLTISTLEAICAYLDLSLLEFFKRMEKVQK